MSIRTFIFLLLLLPNLSYGQEKQVQYLSGTGSNQTVDWDFYCTGGMKSGEWRKIAVPSCWELQGFGHYNYGRDYKTYGKNYRFFDEQGKYRYKFRVPQDWKKKNVFIVFDGVMTDAEVKINGKSAGEMHQGAFYRFKYDITDKLSFIDSNLLEVTVSKMSADASVNNAERLADYWVFGGIFRPVFLEAVPQQRIAYVGIDAKADGSFAAQAVLKGLDKEATLIATIIDQNGSVIKTINKTVSDKDSAIVLNAKITNPKTWTSETPNLYTAKFMLKKENKTLYELKEKFGFRTIEIRRGDGIYVNGVQVKMKGANRHCFWPETGRTLNDSIQLLDVKLMKEMNMNAVRCSHYPPDVRFLELCDSLGLYVLDELAGWQNAYSTKAGEPLVKEMVLRDLNHPSIIFWDNGNEGGTNKELDDDFGKYDFSNRPVIHPHHRPGNAHSGIDCNHYEDYYSTKSILEDSLIYMPTEFMHAQDDGGAGSGMADMWELHWQSKRSGGGFIWALLDEAVMRTDFNNVLDANGVNANDGIMGGHREKEGSFYALKEIYAPVHISLDELPKDFSGKIPVENRYHFTNLKACIFQWALVDYYKPADPFAGYIVKEKGKIASPDIAPLAKGSLSIGLPKEYTNYDALVLLAKDPFGNEIYKWTWKLKSNTQLLSGFLKKDDEDAVLLTETDTSYQLAAADVWIEIGKKDGKLKGVKNSKSGNLSFKNGPVLQHDTSTLTNIKVEKTEHSISLNCSYTGNLKSTTWTMLASGWVKLDYEYSLNGRFMYSGVSFDYPENYCLGAKWLGKGPYRQWKNRTAGTPLNVWENLYNNTRTSYPPLIYPEFKGYYGDIVWMAINTVEGMFYVASEEAGLHVRLFDFYGLSGVKPFPELPTGNISFLDCIPPMGGKLATNMNLHTGKLGPQSELTMLNGATKHTLYFYFGLPKTTDSKELYSRPDVDNVF